MTTRAEAMEREIIEIWSDHHCNGEPEKQNCEKWTDRIFEIIDKYRCPCPPEHQQKTNEAIARLQREVHELRGENIASNHTEMGQEDARKEVLKLKEELQNRLDEIVIEQERVIELEKELQSSMETNAKLHKKLSDASHTSTYLRLRNSLNSIFGAFPDNPMSDDELVAKIEENLENQKKKEKSLRKQAKDIEDDLRKSYQEVANRAEKLEKENERLKAGLQESQRISCNLEDARKQQSTRIEIMCEEKRILQRQIDELTGLASDESHVIFRTNIARILFDPDICNGSVYTDSELLETIEKAVELAEKHSNSQNNQKTTCSENDEKESEEGIWFVWRKDGGSPVYQHESEESAWKEANRLAAIHAPDTFFVAKAIGLIYSKVAIRILRGKEMLEWESIPF